MLLSVVMGNVPMPHYSVRRSVLVNLDLEVRVCFQQSLLHCPREPSADSLIPSNQSTTFIQTFISCHLDPRIQKLFLFGRAFFDPTGSPSNCKRRSQLPSCPLPLKTCFYPSIQKNFRFPLTGVKIEALL